MADFEAIVVGAGCAGSVAAYELARSGKSVLLIERGNYAGAEEYDRRAHLFSLFGEGVPGFEQELP